jgi:hypothetical protein
MAIANYEAGGENQLAVAKDDIVTVMTTDGEGVWADCGMHHGETRESISWMQCWQSDRVQCSHRLTVPIYIYIYVCMDVYSYLYVCIVLSIDLYLYLSLSWFPFVLLSFHGHRTVLESDETQRGWVPMNHLQPVIGEAKTSKRDVKAKAKADRAREKAEAKAAAKAGKEAQRLEREAAKQRRKVCLLVSLIVYTCVRTYAHILYMSKRAHTHTHTHTHTHIYIYTHTHTHTHTHTQYEKNNTHTHISSHTHAFSRPLHPCTISPCARLLPNRRTTRASS